NNVHTASFSQFNNQRIDPLIRVFGPNATVAQDLEPEYIAVSDDSRLAWVTLQENNALATIDIASAQVISLQSFGLKDHSQPENALDVSNRDDAINITTWPVYGMYQPDAIAAFTIRGQQYLITANEGDARDYDGYSEEERVKDLELDPTAFPDADTLQEDENLGRLTVTTAQGDLDGDGDFDAIWSFGARSFSIWSRQGNLVYDSGNALEQITAATLPDQFNSTNDENDSFDNRSDDKGP
ncbi:MAG: choice-of-anchor I family protein, partial [Anaerolineales bacterium]|nr:choice-of-anchor I family protein [Anaerolineales bacterium]